jgi:hypothetical protein
MINPPRTSPSPARALPGPHIVRAMARTFKATGSPRRLAPRDHSLAASRHDSPPAGLVGSGRTEMNGAVEACPSFVEGGFGRDGPLIRLSLLRTDW